MRESNTKIPLPRGLSKIFSRLNLALQRKYNLNEHVYTGENVRKRMSQYICLQFKIMKLLISTADSRIPRVKVFFTKPIKAAPSKTMTRYSVKFRIHEDGVVGGKQGGEGVPE